MGKENNIFEAETQPLPHYVDTETYRMFITFKDESLTPCEQKVLIKVIGGMTNREIAEDLSISEQTTKNHIQNMKNKVVDMGGRRPVSKYTIIHELQILGKVEIETTWK